MQDYSIAQHSGESRENVHTVNSSTQEERFPLTILPLNPVLGHMLAPPLASSFILAFFCPAAAQAFSQLAISFHTWLENSSNVPQVLSFPRLK